MVRTLVPGDEPLIEAFLVPLSDTSMFLRANLRAAGLVDQGKILQGTYVGAFRGDRLVGIVAHWWNGILSVQAPAQLDELVLAATSRSGRALRGLVGPLEQVRRAQHLLGLTTRRANLDSVDVLYALDLSNLKVPPAVRSGEVTVRRASARDEALLARWQHDFRVEALGDTPGPEILAATTDSVRHHTSAGTIFIAEAQGAPVATAIFNATLPDCVQLGGVWTPVALRSRGHARAVTAGALQLAAADGVTRSVLFTQENNAPARRAYEALGYVDSGRFALALYDAR